jgi:hypothetical protein
MITKSELSLIPNPIRIYPLTVVEGSKKKVEVYVIS